MNTFKLQDLILEGRLEDVKKKFPEFNPEIIDYLSQQDPSGNNKYLEWMVSAVKSFGGEKRRFNDDIIERIEGEFLNNLKKFHDNLNKITAELVHEVFQNQGWLGLMSDNSPAGKMIQRIHKTPKDINSYYDFKSGSNSVMLEIVRAASEKLTKAEIKRLESNVLLNNQDLLILIPKSYKASCYYGAGTRWCTTNKTSDTYYNRYTTNGTLIYVIDKKATMENDWYRTAFFIDRKSGDAQAFDAPDNPTSIEDASKHLGDKWGPIRDTIIEYLYTNDLKGIDNFYVGSELLSWLESKDLDPLKILGPKKMILQLGYDGTLAYLKKRGIDLFDFFDDKMLFDVFVSKTSSVNGGVKSLWDEYKKRDINPLYRMFKGSYIPFIVESVESGDLTLDDFLEQATTLGENKDLSARERNIFVLMEHYFGGNTSKQLINLFKSPELIFGFADLIHANLFEDLGSNNMRHLLRLKFIDPNDALKYVVQHIDSLRSKIENYGFDRDMIFSSLDVETIMELIKQDKIGNVGLGDFITLFGTSVETFWKFFDFNFELGDKENKWVDEYDIYPFIEHHAGSIKRIFPNIFELQKAIRERSTETFKIIDFGDHQLWSYLNEDYYELYHIYKEADRVSRLDDLLLIKAYTDAHPDDTEIKSLVLERITEHFSGSGSKSGSLITEGNSHTIVTHDLCVFDIFNGGWSNFLCQEHETRWEEVAPDRDDITQFIDNAEISRLIKEHLMDNLRDTKITLNKDWIDEFDAWVENIDDVEDTFSFILYDERISGMSDHKLEVMIMFAKELVGVRRALITAHSDAHNTILTSIVKNKYIDGIESTFGGRPNKGEMEIWSQSLKQDVTRGVYTTKYNHLLEDAIGYADYFVWDHDSLPDNAIRMVRRLMREDVGRFSDGLVYIDVEDVISEHHPELYNDTMINEMSDILYNTLIDIDYSEEQKPLKPQRKKGGWAR
jgi:hypothetical protein